MNPERPNTQQKALQINLDGHRHGTFAEIGAGQEVARWFFRAGGASATVSKTISAYDMTVSDAIYGPTDRYVGRRRLWSMLEYEFDLLRQRLDAQRGADTMFFALADTVAARSYSRHEEGHGWMGVRFQHEPRAEPSEIIIHLHMHDAENVRQQEALGVVGVNLMYGAFFLREDPATLIASLMDHLAPGRVEVDMIRFAGPAFENLDNRLMSLQLVEQKFTDAVMFNAEGEVVQPAEALYKHPVLIQRGSFRPVTNTVMDMLTRSEARFKVELQTNSVEPVVIAEMSLQNLLSGQRIDHRDFLARADILRALGKTVMISRFSHHYQVATYLREHTAKQLVFAMGIPAVQELFEEKYYTKLEGGILEALGTLFKRNLNLYVYPSKDPATGRVITAKTLQFAPHMQHLYAFLLENHLLESLPGVTAEQLHIYPRNVLDLIQGGDPAWETMVPPEVARCIKEGRLFGYQTA